VLCLQELKLEDHNFPKAEIEAAGYQVAFSGQKTYNGVALLARQPIHDVVCGNPHFPDEQKRLISGTVDGTRVICAYMPNGQEVGSDKYDYKLRWLDALAVWLGEELRNTRSSRCAATTTSPPTTAMCTTRSAGPARSSVPSRSARLPAPARPRPDRQLPPLRAAGKDLLVVGLPHARLPEEPRPAHRPRAALRRWPSCAAAGIDRAPRKLERPSDHAPVWAEIGQPA
jgi:exodeoxyribonuclease-3